MDVLATCGGPVILGRTGENDYATVVFPFDGPAGASVTVFNRLPGSVSSYPVAAVEVQDGTVRWTVSSADLSVNGYGECEITYTLGDVVAKSVRYPTQVIASLDGQGDPPEGWDTWQAVFTALKAQAEAAAQTATDAAQTAESASEAIQNLSVSSTTLTPGSAATLEKTVDPETGAVNLAFGIPEGQQGETGPIGATPGISIGTVTTGAAGSSASATMTGTPENPVLNLTIPRGNAGKDGEPGKDGDPGPAGISPTVTVTDIEGGHRITITDANGPHSIDVMNGTGSVQDVQVNGTSVLQDGVANVPIATGNMPGAVKVQPTGYSRGIVLTNDGIVTIDPATSANIKGAGNVYRPIIPPRQHEATFYGIAKAAGDATQSASSNAVGNYTDAAKSAISQMLNSPVTVTGSTPSITALAGVQYVCGEVSTLDIIPPASGCFDVIFESGSTPTALTISNPTGTTVEWRDDFDPTNLSANAVYEINLLRMGTKYLGVAASWT